MEKNNRVDFAKLRENWRDNLTGKGADMGDPNVKRQYDALVEDARSLMNTMNRDEARTCLWNELPDPNNVYLRDTTCQRSVERIERMALAYSSEHSALKGDVQLKETIFDALEFIYKNWYSDTIRKGGEWWHKEIGIPLVMNRCCALMYDDMPPELRCRLMRAVHSFTSTPHEMCIDDMVVPEGTTGANRTWKCLALAGCGINSNDVGKLLTAAHHIKDVFFYASRGDGFYRDGSFVQHGKFAYTGGYGNSLMRTITDYMEVLAGTPFNISGEELAMVMDWVTKSYEPFLYQGGFMSMTRGREIARQYRDEHVNGHDMIMSFIKLAYSLPDDVALPFKSKIKAWISSDHYRDFFEYAPIPMIPRARAIMEDPSIPVYEFPSFCGIYPAMDRVMHRRGDYAVGISMNSERTGKYESIHDENMRGWYTSEGMVYLYNSDLGQFSDDYFPTINAYRMPGTTVDTAKREVKGIGYGKEPRMHTTWVGGTQIDNLYGAVGMEIENDCTDLGGMKSWFLFDEEIVCLGSGITATTGREIETVVENRKIDKTAKLSVNGEACELAEKCITRDIKTAHLKGADRTSDIGYYFPQDHELELLREDRTDCWKNINKFGGNDTPVSGSFMNIVIHHGVDPKNDGYQYVLLPGKSAEETQRYANDPKIEILENSTKVQAVKHNALGIVGANFLTDTACRVDAIRCDAKASVMLRESDGCLEIAAADPTWKREAPIVIEIEKAASGVNELDDGVEVVQLAPTVKLSIHVNKTKGTTLHAKLSLE